MTKKVLLVGLEYTGDHIFDVDIETLGLCRSEINDENAAFALYEYDLVIINPESYSHFIFGRKREFSDSKSELSKLKHQNNDYDLDTVFDRHDRREELTGAFNTGTRVIWLLADEKRESFFGWRKTHIGYINKEVEKIVNSNEVHRKKSRKLNIDDNEHKLSPYFKQVEADSWRYCIDLAPEIYTSIASTPEGYSLGVEIKVGDHIGWLLTPPRSQEGISKLITCALELSKADMMSEKFEGIFLSHTNDDKPFVRDLKKLLEDHGVNNVWLDEAEIQIGDSLTKKIDEGLTKTRYIAVVLSPRSVNSPWVQKELEIAINREITTGEVVVLPLIYEHCELPTFLQGKLYADFSSADEYDRSLKKLIRRLTIIK
jgi:hypothetical protein